MIGEIRTSSGPQTGQSLKTVSHPPSPAENSGSARRLQSAAPPMKTPATFMPKWKKDALSLVKGGKKFVDYKRDLLKPERVPGLRRLAGSPRELSVWKTLMPAGSRVRAGGQIQNDKYKMTQ